MTKVDAVLLVFLLAALIRIPIPGAPGKAGRVFEVLAYLLVIFILLVALLTKAL